MPQIKTRLQIWSALAALGTIASLAIPAATAFAQGSAPTTRTVEQLAADARLLAGTSSEGPSLMHPESTYLPGLGWEVDEGGPAVRIELFSED